ncbi:amphoterin-induced protein 2-like [Toxorhynchites rutilus septentrionalis]|uniref:amphoterin-induced protein 2-like n=1 Tax=Toxorhynchites rutilus septentrionalis TaxID=329112 RepID=UPI00247AE49E|nr:amphoterin-induced protein 2-like [Toxorhynchites rutilus septentrionalis]
MTAHQQIPSETTMASTTSSSSSSSISDTSRTSSGRSRTKPCSSHRTKTTTTANSSISSITSARLLVALILMNVCIAHSGAERSCPAACQCKWKGGKQAVECIDKQLIIIPEHIDHSTQVLDMSGNNLQILPKETFSRANLLNLQKLYLRNCRLGQIDDGAFAGLTNLVELDLSLNLLTAVPSASFQYIASLRDLTLARNHIQKIDSHAFRNVTSLNKLDLSYCEIQTIAPQAFEGLTSLHSLKLNGNQLSELRPKTIETLSKLHGVELHENPWVCDCRLRATKVWLADNNIPYPIAPICAGGPERIIGKTFGDLHVDDFACKPEMLPVRRYIQAFTGENASIECRTSAVPSASVNWYWNGKLLANNSQFSSYQRVYVYEQGNFEKRSRLVLTNAQETDSNEFYCVVENRAGTAEANFTLHVVMRDIGFAIENKQIIGLSVALVILILFILLSILFLLVRLRRMPMTETKTPGQVEVITSVSPSSNVNGKVSTPINDVHSPDRKNSGDLKCANPVQKPPRLTDLPYSTSHYDAGGSLIASGNCFVSPTHSSAGNNPDLINDTKRLGSVSDLAGGTGPPGLGDNSSAGVPLSVNMATAFNTLSLMDPIERPGSGEYSRAGCDSLYPSGLWETHSSNLTSALEQTTDMLLTRAPSSTIASGGYTAYSDKMPIIGGANNNTLNLDDETSSVDYLSRTFPRTHFGGSGTLAVAGGGGGNSSSGSSVVGAVGGTGVVPSGGGGGYPSDYGLPIVPGAEQLHNKLSSLQPAHHGSTGSMPMNAKTLRVWQKGGVPVLPPVTALKRALSNSRNSPDEGYQEGCGTDV